jgi:hypothetical protein
MIAKRVLILRVIKAFILLVVAWGLLAFLAAYETIRTRKQAEEFRAELARLRVGESTLDQVMPLIATYHGEWWRPRPLALDERDVTPCGYPYRQVEFKFENRWLHWVLFAPRTRFGGGVHLKDNRVCFRSMGMITTAGGIRGVNVNESREGREAHPFARLLNPWKTVVIMTAAATIEQRTAAYSFNLDCLTNLRGCPDAMEMAPAIWRLGTH